MKKKILTLTLLSTLFATLPQGAYAAEQQMSPADRLKAMAARRMNPQAHVGAPVPALVQGPPAVVPGPVHLLPVPGGAPGVPHVPGLNANVGPQAGGLPVGPVHVAVVPANHEAEYLALIRQFMGTAYTPAVPTSADVTAAFNQVLLGTAGADFFTRVQNLREQRTQAQRELLAANQRLEALGNPRLQGILGHVPSVVERAADDVLRANLGGRDPLAADYANIRLRALLGGRAPTPEEIAYAAGHLGDADAALTAGVVNARLTTLLGRAPTAPETAYAIAPAHLADADAPLVAALVDARLNALLGRAPTVEETAYAAGHLADADAALVAALVNARLNDLLGRAPTVEETAYAAAHLADAVLVPALVNVHLNALLGRAPTAAERAYAAAHLADADAPLVAALVDARLNALLGRAPTVEETAHAAAHLADADAVLVPGLVAARLTALLGRAPTAAETAYAVQPAHLADAAAVLVPALVDARLNALLGRAPTAAETAYAVQPAHLADADAVLVPALVDARLNALLGRAPTAAETAYAVQPAHLADADAALVPALVDARLNVLLGRAPTAAETAYAVQPAHLADADAVLVPGLVAARLNVLLGRAPTAAETAYAGQPAHLADADAALMTALVDMRLNPLLGGRVLTAAERGYADGHMAAQEQPFRSGLATARLNVLLGRAPTQEERLYARNHLDEADPAIITGVVNARLTHLIGAGRAPVQAETDYARAHLDANNADLTNGIIAARLTPLLGGRAPNAAETAHAAGHLADADAVLVPALVDVRLNALLGRAPTAEESAYAVAPAHLGDTDVVLTEGVARARLSHLVGVRSDRLTPEQVAYVSAHPLDNDDALLTGCETARLTALLAGGVPTPPQIAEAVRLRRNASLVEIQEGIDLWNAGAAGGFRASYDEVASSRYLKDQVTDANNAAADAHAAAIALLPVGAAQPPAPVPAVINPIHDELIECVRLLNEAGLMENHADLLDYSTVQEAFRIKGLAAAGGVPNPYAGGLNSEQFAEAVRLKKMKDAMQLAGLPGFPAGGMGIQGLREALRLKEYPEIQAQAYPANLAQAAGGATLAQIGASRVIQRQVNPGAGAMRWTLAGGFQAVVAPAPMFENPTPIFINAAVHLRTKQGAGAGIDQPRLDQVKAVANPQLDEQMKAALARAIQNPIAGVAAPSNVPFGIARVINAPGAHFELQFVQFTGAALPAPVEANLYNTVHGNPARDGIRVPVANLPGAADGDIFAFSDMAADGVLVRLTNPTKVN